MTAPNAVREAQQGNGRLEFTECREQSTAFHFLCTSAEQASGTITTNTMVTHNVYLNEAKTKQGVMLTGASTTLTCAGGYVGSTTTGDIIGELETVCGTTGTT